MTVVLLIALGIVLGVGASLAGRPWVVAVAVTGSTIALLALATTLTPEATGALASGFALTIVVANGLRFVRRRRAAPT